jgi:hypothetical protein
MFADIEVAKLLVPDHVEAITSALARASRMKPRRRPSMRAARAPQARTAATPRARPLHGESGLPAIQHALSKHEMPKDRLGKHTVQRKEDDDVEVLFDLLEGLYHEADEQARAARLHGSR